jgi:UDP-N-acetylmuramate dehydrogenase
LNKSEIIGKLSGILAPKQILIDEKMSAHTTFRIGGAADLLLEINNEAELKSVLKILNGEFFLIGNGSNLLVSDEGIRGAVIHLSKSFSTIKVEEDTLTCKAGATLAMIARTALENSLTGFEFAAGIPGSLGGAIVMNAGAYDGEMRRVVKSVKLMTYDGEIVTKSNEEMHFSYRHSLLKEEKYIVLEVEIGLERGDKAVIKEKMDDLAKRRRDKQPLEYPSAGSTFKRPEGYFAARLIEDAGLKGYKVGGATVSTKHCGFVVNTDNATAKDVYTLIKDIQLKVKETSGVMIEPEVILVGEF